MSKGPRKNTDVQHTRTEPALDQRTLITLTEYVQRLGGMDRARQALETLRELKRAA